jgi:hypothetical protein
MGENNESFGDELTKLANIVEIIENSFIGKTTSNVEIKISEEKLLYLSNNLNYEKNDRIIINIGSVNFVFLKK